MSRNHFKLALGALALGGSAFSLHAQMAQDPLLSRTAAVEPNIVFVFDDSGSMNSTAMYQFGGGTGYQGQRGPNDDAECVGGTGCVWTNPPTTFHGRSPDVNLIYYDPRVTYKRRINPDGSFQAAGSTTGIGSFNVYFYRPPTGNVFSVASVTVTNKGQNYPATGVTATFNAPPAGGVQATATVNVAPSNGIGSVTINSGGTGMPASPGVTISAPPAGGVQATATATVANVGALGSVILDNTKTFPNAACTATVSAPPAPGVTASVTAIRQSGGGSRPIQSFTINSAGSNYTVAPTVSVNCGGTVRTFNTTLTTTRTITGITITNPGAGYTALPTVAITGGGTGFAGTPVFTPIYRIDTITVTNPGSGYRVAPTLTLNNTAPGTGAAFTVNTTTAPAPSVNAKWDGAGTPTTAGFYFTPSYTPDAASPLAADADTTLAGGVPVSSYSYPNVASSAQARYPKFRNRTDCATPGYCTWAEEVQNFANWRTYHSTRLQLAKTGIGLAFQPLNPKFRLGWGTINSITNFGALTAGVQLYDSTVQSNFLNWLYSRAANGSTPNRTALDRVGRYFQRADDNGPWGNNPNGSGSLTASGSNSGHAACRRSYAMLMTDGYYNDFFNIADWDSTPRSVTSTPTAYTYQPVGPFSDSVSGTTSIANTFADVAMRYYLADLRTDLANNVRPVPGDEAYWQHLNFYAIGLGVVGTLNAADPAVLRSLTGTTSTSPPRTRSWPTPAANSATSIDDMWHATINGRGKLLNAKTSDDLNDAITKMMSDISGKEGTQSGVAVSTASLTMDTKKYTPSYTPVSWTGNVTAFRLDPTNANQTGVAWEVEKLVSDDASTGVKTYQSLIPAHNVRNIYAGNGAASGTPRAVAFTYNGLGAGLRGQMGAATVVTPALIDYLRGDATNEDTSSSSASATAIYRPRQTRLGDVVNSTPVFVKDSVDLQYDLTTVAGASSYRAHVDRKKQRPEGVIFVGANDGMLHAFRDGIYSSSQTPLTEGGVEVFAYVPYAVLPTLKELSDKTYVHRYYVDGPNTETDAYLPARGGWRNIVMGSTGAGAGAPAVPGSSSPRTGVYAIDVTSLDTSVTSLNADSVMWEVNSTQAGFTELGYVLTDIQAGVTRDGTWVAVFGNGYESRSCQARLFVVNMATGALVREINTATGNCATARNGLGGVRLVKNSNQEIIGVYAGDLLGNLWKFNLNNTSPGSWGVDLGGNALFTAGANQPITAPPSVLALPMRGTTDPQPGHMVMFGTGKFFEIPDITNVRQQSLYGIWDWAQFGGPVPAGTALTDRSLLQRQTVGAGQVGPNGNTYFQVSSTAIDYRASPKPRGWYIDLPAPGQRLVYPIDLLARRFAVFDTISPANVSLDPCTNEQGGVGFLYVIDAVNGGGPAEAILDTNGDNVVDGNDMIVSGLESKADGRNVNLDIEKNELVERFGNVSGGDPGATIISISCRLTNDCRPPSGGNVPAHRQWRQLFLR